MPYVVYHLPDGTSSRVEVAPGQSIMEGSVRNNLPGIVAECAGNCACATCHVRVGNEWKDLFAERSDEENDLLAYLDGSDDDSRLGCQLIVEDTDIDIHVRVVDSR
ncbi:2Fe-2S iron-sulfur cluster binding domain-containing protein [Rhodococcus zopfii]|uniref:2Fe-2S iron-sulfur cluster binding domain-containing protein n=1 Tax=Rhodococcus zopfii TaxID=43772 RepID=A0ABU3WSW0_9NOCA|nr:2Fe-2S iron-sulfur cluster binding domain-containing protein [Rhodococcus zopfii]